MHQVPACACSLHVINPEVREIPVLSQSETLRFSFLTFPVSGVWCSWQRYQRRASASCLCIQDAISELAPDVGSDIGQDRCLSRAGGASWFPARSWGPRCSSRTAVATSPPAAALSSPALANVTKGSVVSDATACFNILRKLATAKRFARVRTFLKRLIKAHFHPVPLGEQKHLAVTSE